jgi:DNA repair photolyase
MITPIVVKSVLNKHKKRDSWFLDEYSINPYQGCSTTRMLEPGVADPMERLTLLRDFKKRGLLCGVNAIPLLPLDFVARLLRY